MPDTIHFRQATLADTVRIAALVNSAYRGDSSRKGWTTEADWLDGQRTDTAAIEEILSAPDQWIVLGERKAQLIGSMHFERATTDICHFGMFAIAPELQARGFGKRFMAEAERLARDELNCLCLRLSVITLRHELIAWYERRGYRRTGELQPFPYGDERFGLPLRDDLEFEVLEKSLLP